MRRSSSMADPTGQSPDLVAHITPSPNRKSMCSLTYRTASRVGISSLADPVPSLPRPRYPKTFVPGCFCCLLDRLASNVDPGFADVRQKCRYNRDQQVRVRSPFQLSCVAPCSTVPHDSTPSGVSAATAAPSFAQSALAAHIWIFSL